MKNIHINVKSKTNRGFTLLELIIVTAVLAILSVLFINTFPSTQRRSRDTTRKSDIKQYQTAVELYNNKQGAYPSPGAINLSTPSFCSNAGGLGLPSCPDDPKSPNRYRIISDGNEYVMFATLEQPASPTTYFVVCSNGITDECTTIPNSATWCNTSMNSTTCP